MRSSTGEFTIEVVVHGRPLREYPYEGETFVEGRDGSPYTLRVRNNSTRRCLAIVSVDGLSVMDGKTASSKDSGYVISPYGVVDIDGFRLNDHDVARFRFGMPEESYASLIGKPGNLGVIGTIIFREKQKMPVYRGRASSDFFEDSGFTYRGSAMRGGDSVVSKGLPGLGTTFGERTQSEVSRVNFDREDSEAARMAIRYDTEANLLARGIKVSAPHSAEDRVLAADPFPGEAKGATPPPGWRG